MSGVEFERLKRAFAERDFGRLHQMEDYRGNLLLVEINYSKEKKEYTCVVEDWEKDS